MVFTEESKKDLKSMPKELQPVFIKHLEKIGGNPPKKHMKYVLPYHVEKFTRQARIIYSIDHQKLFIIRCFAKHKDYEKWYESFK